jgi:tRNA(Ile)-lysidine synthase
MPLPLEILDGERLFSTLENSPGVLMAVSGGADSLALAWLLVRWNNKHRVPLFCATVDHGLRPESAREAAHVAKVARNLGIFHAVLCWEGDKPDKGLEKAAREAR